MIAQQWKFTYRWPGYGGVETDTLELPANRPIEFHVTSLDVIHSFWAYQLGVKADANPGVDNIAYVHDQGPADASTSTAPSCAASSTATCSTPATSCPQAQFASWIAQQQQQFAPATKSLPPYAKQYFPEPQRRGG